MKVLITGGTGLLGNATKTVLEKKYDIISINSKDCDLTNFEETKKLFSNVKPDILIHLAAQVGGIGANNKNKLDFFEVNNFINLNTIKSAIDNNVKYIVASGTACAYPKKFEGQILVEDTYLDGFPEITNDAYAYSKRSLLCHLIAAKETKNIDYCFFIPTNIFGPYDYFNKFNSHIIPGVINRMHEAKKENQIFKAWGTGTPKRDFLFVDDCAKAISIILDNRFKGSINIASGNQHSIYEVVNYIKEIINFKLDIEWDNSKPDGQMERAINISKIKKLGWVNQNSLKTGLEITVKWFLENQDKARV